MGRRDPHAVDVSNVAPLCRFHHTQGDSPGWSWRRFALEYCINLNEVAVAVWRQWLNLPAPTRARWESKADRKHKGTNAS